jgi:hypothetical protein
MIHSAAYNELMLLGICFMFALIGFAILVWCDVTHNPRWIEEREAAKRKEMVDRAMKRLYIPEHPAHKHRRV